MDSRDPTITHYAVLVGIDDYPSQPLKSAACDAREARRLLDSKLKDCVKIYPLVADQHDQNSPPSVQEPLSRPTRENLVNTLDTVIKIANPGSFVYIHFSGHGTRKTPEKGKESGDVGLVLLNQDVSNEVSYLWGEELAALVKLMVDKNLTVTVVLDCCFSGAAYRRDSEARYLPYDAKMDLLEKHIQSNSLEAQSHSLYRDILFLPNWLVDPKGYAIIAACGPYENSSSREFDGQSNGILSYYLFDTLKYIGFTRSLKTVYDRLCTKIRSCKFDQNQNPILYGNKNQAFFGSLGLNSIGINIPIIKRRDGSIELQAGYAHGISVGDEFAVFPAKETISNQSSMIASAIRCNGLTSILDIPGSPTNSARSGWLARVVKQSHLQNIPIRVASSISNASLWLSAMNTRSLKVHDDTSNNPIAFELVLDDDRQYQLLDENGTKLANLPAMPQYQTIPDEVCDILEHLARFRLAKDLSNKVSATDHLDKVDTSIKYDRKSYGPTDKIVMKHGTIAEVIVTNRGDKPVFAFVYYLGSSWQVEQVFRGSYYLIQPNRSEKKKFKITMPKSAKNPGYETCIDILKIIITSQPTSFDVLELPRLREPARRGSGGTNRDAVEGLENWTAVNFPIHISKGEKDRPSTIDVNQ